MQEWFKVKQAAKYCGLSERTLRTHLKVGLPYSRVRGTILIKHDWLDGYLESFKVVESNPIDKMGDEMLEGLRR